MLSGGVGSVVVHTTENRGSTPEEVAERCLEKIISVSGSAPEPIRQQAESFRDSLREVIVFYVKQAIQSDRTTVCNALTEAGQPELAQLIRRV
jgi:hypothetical protein